MRIIAEDVDGSMYTDLIISEEEAGTLKNGAILEATTMCKSKRIYVGLRIGEKWRYENKKLSYIENEGD